MQPFTATDDPRDPGIEPIPNIQSKIDAMIEKYRRKTIDIEDVEFEEYDLELLELFPTIDEAHGKRQPEAGAPFGEPKSI